MSLYLLCKNSHVYPQKFYFLSVLKMPNTNLMIWKKQLSIISPEWPCSIWMPELDLGVEHSGGALACT